MSRPSTEPVDSPRGVRRESNRWRQNAIGILVLMAHEMRRADSLADCTAGKRSEIKTEIMAMTTSSSISVNPERFFTEIMISATIPSSVCISIETESQCHVNIVGLPASFVKEICEKEI